MFDTAFPIVLFLVTLVLGMPIGFSLIVAGAWRSAMNCRRSNANFT